MMFLKTSPGASQQNRSNFDNHHESNENRWNADAPSSKSYVHADGQFVAVQSEDDRDDKILWIRKSLRLPDRATSKICASVELFRDQGVTTGTSTSHLYSALEEMGVIG